MQRLCNPLRNIFYSNRVSFRNAALQEKNKCGISPYQVRQTANMPAMIDHGRYKYLVSKLKRVRDQYSVSHFFLFAGRGKGTIKGNLPLGAKRQTIKNALIFNKCQIFAVGRAQMDRGGLYAGLVVN